ncbi:hypothetical protein PAC01_06490 [Pediococcus acidilactici]|nr:hypothetical protein PAC01_06490 [Pediococcus acidilactici]
MYSIPELCEVSDSTVVMILLFLALCALEEDEFLADFDFSDDSLLDSSVDSSSTVDDEGAWF